MSTTKLRVNDVFVPGGLPRYTYVPRESRGLEERLIAVKDNLCKIATVTGSTKSGKTVLTKKVLGQGAVWLDGGLIHTLEEFWDFITDDPAVVDEESHSSATSSGSEIGAELSAEAGLFVAKATGKISPKKTASKVESTSKKHTPSKKAQVLRILKDRRTPIIIDDFHYIPRELQGQLTRILKPLVFEGLPVVYLAIPHRRFDAVKVEREMNGRVENVLVPMWEEIELATIPQLGFPLLNIAPAPDISAHLAKEAHGSPHLMQEFCRKICFQSGIKETCDIPHQINPKSDFERIFKDVANDLGRNIFDKLARGPRSRTERKPRKLKTGKTVDIYRVVLIALANLKPTVTTIEYEPLRASIRNILDDDLPQAHEVSRVLEQMAKISSTDESSVPVIDYEKDDRKLHITDPFFAFFLRWGREMIDA